MSKYLYDFSSKSYKRNPQILFSRDNDHHLIFKVHLTSKYFFRSNKSLHLFETRCAFLPRFNPNLDFLQAVKVTKLIVSTHKALQACFESAAALYS